VRLAAALLLALVLAAPAAASERHPTLGELEGEVMCPTCKTTLDQSSAPIANRIRQFIAARRAVNGQDRAALIADYALRFQDALLAGGCA